MVLVALDAFETVNTSGFLESFDIVGPFGFR